MRKVFDKEKGKLRTSTADLVSAIYDAVDEHNTNELSHQDIRQEISSIKQNYTTNIKYNNLLNKYNELDTKYNALQQLVNDIVEKNHLRT